MPINRRARTPVLQFRVPKDLYLAIVHAAQKSGRSISEEAAKRVAATIKPCSHCNGSGYQIEGDDD